MKPHILTYRSKFKALIDCLNRFVNTLKNHLILEFNVIEVSAHLQSKFKKNEQLRSFNLKPKKLH